MARRKNNDESGPLAKVTRRRAPSAYSIFLKTSWDKESKKESYSSFVKECAQKWAKMSEEQKKEFKEEAATLKDKIVSEKAKESKEGAKKKRPPGPYLIFCGEFREKIKKEHPDWAMTAISKELGRIWNGLPTTEKEKYHAAANQQKEKFLKDKKQEETKKDDVNNSSE